MTRKTLVVVISVIYVISGFSNLSNALFSVLFSSGIIVLNLFPLVGGALVLYAGLTLLRFNEFGRKLVVLLLSIRVVMNVLLLLRLPGDGAGFGIRDRLGEIIYSMESPYAFQGFLLAWIVIAFLLTLFLSQKETREIFVPEVKQEVQPGIIFE